MVGRLAVAATLLAAAIAPPTPAQTPRGPRPVLTAAGYFPLHAGNRWVYARIGPAGGQEWVAEVSADARAGRGAVVLTGYFDGPRRVRVHGDGTVLEDSGEGRDALWYQLGARPGTTWRLELAERPGEPLLPACVSGSTLVLASREEAVTVPAGTFAHVVRVDYRGPCADAGIVAEWFAPGVGLVRREETSFAGPVVSELQRYELGGVPVPPHVYTTALDLDGPLYVNNLMPPVAPEALPTLRGSFSLRNLSVAELALRFTGCRRVAVQVEDEAGQVVVEGGADDGGCCACDNVVETPLGRGLALPFAFRLVRRDGSPLPDGRYAVVATLVTTDPPPLRPSARAVIEVRSVH